MFEVLTSLWSLPDRDPSNNTSTQEESPQTTVLLLFLQESPPGYVIKSFLFFFSIYTNTLPERVRRGCNVGSGCVERMCNIKRLNVSCVGSR